MLGHGEEERMEAELSERGLGGGFNTDAPPPPVFVGVCLDDIDTRARVDVRE